MTGVSLGPRRRVVVLFGGRSAEHEVSCTSAVFALRSLDPHRYDISTIGITPDGAWVPVDGLGQLAAGSIRLAISGAAADPASLLGSARRPGSDVGSTASPGPATIAGTTANAGTVGAARPTANAGTVGDSADWPVVIPILHGPNGEDGTMQGFLEVAGVPYVGAGVLASAVAMDKSVAKELLAHARLPVARWVARRTWELKDLAEAAVSLGFPCFVKPANLGSSIGVTKAHDVAELGDAIAHAAEFDDTVIVEEAIHGREIEFSVLGNDEPMVSGAGEIRPGKEFYDYEDKYLSDAAQYQIPASLTPAQLAAGQALVVAVYRALRIEGLARVDLFFDDRPVRGGGRGWVVNEANTMPGMTPISMYPKLWEAAGVSYSEVMDRLIDLAIARYARRSGRVGRARLA